MEFMPVCTSPRSLDGNSAGVHGFVVEIGSPARLGSCSPDRSRGALDEKSQGERAECELDTPVPVLKPSDLFRRPSRVAEAAYDGKLGQTQTLRPLRFEAFGGNLGEAFLVCCGGGQLRVALVDMELEPILVGRT